MRFQFFYALNKDEISPILSFRLVLNIFIDTQYIYYMTRDPWAFEQHLLVDSVCAKEAKRWNDLQFFVHGVIQFNGKVTSLFLIDFQ